MIPPLIIQQAAELGIEILAITDHNASANAGAVIDAAHGTPITVLPGMEIQTREDIHCLCLFDSLDQVQALQQHVDKTLPCVANEPGHFGEQYVVDSTGEFIRTEERLLLTSCSMSLEETAAIVVQLGGLFIPAHVNRQAFGLIPVLGFIPDDLPISAVEISRHLSPSQAYAKFPQLRQYPMIQSGDVHRLDEFLAPNFFSMEHPCISEMRKALQGLESRKIEIRSIL